MLSTPKKILPRVKTVTQVCSHLIVWRMEWILVVAWKICYTLSKYQKARTIYQTSMSVTYLSDKLFLPFELNDKDNSILGDPDPVLSFYIMNQHVAQCNSYLDPCFNEHITKKVPGTKSGFTHCHVNIRSIRKNFEWVWNLPTIIRPSIHNNRSHWNLARWFFLWNLWHKRLQECWETQIRDGSWRGRKFDFFVKKWSRTFWWRYWISLL